MCNASQLFTSVHNYLFIIQFFFELRSNPTTPRNSSASPIPFNKPLAISGMSVNLPMIDGDITKRSPVTSNSVAVGLLLMVFILFELFRYIVKSVDNRIEFS